MTYAVEFKPSARRQLENLPRRVQEQITVAIDALELEPRPYGIEKIQGAVGQYRLRVGAYRVVFEIDDDVRLVTVVGIGHRSIIYRHFALILLALR